MTNTLTPALLSKIVIFAVKETKNLENPKLIQSVLLRQVEKSTPSEFADFLATASEEYTELKQNIQALMIYMIANPEALN
jgi:hypothetical protein